ncbi:tetratricopeptide repeat protein [uncultured Chitinophaga sp.]|uniref:type IX secretion system periplasmic lipoprotein PorW/SprE n=1 Tax=uncultured Chitinophaga sp. TaxID=339340 RepID=UPI002614E391|nr:tetratricopeptide repeat protein [uncultured Chitinophaga sp.]
MLLSTGPLAVSAQSKDSGSVQRRTPVKTQVVPKVQDRRPPSEKMAEKKFTWNRRLMQNLVTRYNYYYNAKMKLDNVVKNVARQGLDNYNDLLPFYPYSLQDLGLNKNDLDSVIIKASVGIQIHDPRGKWIDDCYLLIGRAYFYKSDWENAQKTFQFMNIAFAPKKKTDYTTVIGSNENDQISVATKEKRKGIFGKVKHKKARNDAFLWSARTLLEQKEYDQVQGLLNLLDADPNFPRRLDGDLAEVRAYSHYKQGRYAETINPLREAIKESDNRESRARMSFILGQLYARQAKADSAMAMFRKVIRQKPDPMMDFQARIQIAQLNVQGGNGTLEQSLAALRSMLKKERFIPYRDAIYYTMATLSAPSNQEAALGFLQQSLKQPSDNPVQKALSFKAVADIYYSQRKYQLARNFYDSTAAVMPPEFADANLVNVRKAVLGDVADRVTAIQREDSLQWIAAMPETSRQAFLEQMAANIRKAAEEDRRKAAKALAGQEEDNNSFNNALAMNNPFGGNGPRNGANTNDQGDWYFYNNASKASGYSEFKRRWGNRQAADNWRRSQQNTINLANNQPLTDQVSDSLLTGEVAGAKTVPPDSVTAQSLGADLPLTPEKLEQSRTVQMDAWFDLGKLYHDKLDDTQLAIDAYDSLLLKFPDHPRKPEVLYSLYVWHSSLKDHTAQADRYKNMVLTQYGNTNFANIIKFGALQDVDADRKKQISTAYDAAYTAYRTGNYELALERKRQADSTFGFNYLAPKFDMLEAMIIVKTDTTDALTDSLFLGKRAVEAVMNKYPGDEGIHAQAQALLDALNRKKDLVAYLAQLQIQKRDSGGTMVDEDVSIRYPWQTPKPQLDSATLKTAAPGAAPVIAGNVTATPPPPMTVTAPPPPPKPVTPYKLSATNPHFVVLSFQKVSKALLDEGLEQFTRYNASKHAADKIEVGSFVLSPTEVMLVFRLFPDENKALDYFDEIREAAPTDIIPRIRPTDYSMFVISRDNFILLNSTKDLQGYREFFDKNYITQ